MSWPRWTTSATVDAVGPWVENSIQRGSTLRPTVPMVGFRPTRPHRLAGIRMLPPPSEVVASGASPAASAAPEPPLDPPGDRSRFHGFRVAPKTWLVVTAVWPKAGELVRPTTIAPGGRSRATTMSSMIVGRSVRVQRRTERRRAALAPRHVLDEQRKSGERAGPGMVAGLGERLVGVHADHGVQVGVGRLDATQALLDELLGGHVPVADRGGQFHEHPRTLRRTADNALTVAGPLGLRCRTGHRR